MYTESDLLPISALQHLAFCERQWGLIHLEQVWEESRLTVEGHLLHDRVHDAETEMRGDVRVARGVRLRSLRLGLTGKADVVEFHRISDVVEGRGGADSRPLGVRLKGVSGLWRPVPVEYKRGKQKHDHCDEVQLCAQALCLEEMLNVTIPSAFLFYGRPRRRYEVSLDQGLRKETEMLSERLQELTRASKTPPAKYEKKCDSCSLLNLCLPKATGGRRSVKKYLEEAFNEPRSGKEP